MTLTVRLRRDLETALELHCAERGVTKSLVVQQVLGEYLARPDLQRARRADEPAAPSANYRAFEALGLIGCVSDVGPADKAGVRAAIARRLEAKKAAREAAATSATAANPPAPSRRRQAR